MAGNAALGPPHPSAEADTFARRVVETEYLLRSVASIVRQRGREILSGYEITPPQFDALLRLLRAEHPLTMGALCQQLYLASSTVTDLVDRMEKNELVQRVRDPEDRRVVRLVVREKGRSVYDQVMEERKHYLSCILGRVSVGDRDRLTAALAQVHELMTSEEARAR